MKKRNWKKMTAAAAILAMTAMTLGACGGSSASGVEAIKERGVVKVGVKADVPKFSLQNTATGEYEGFEDDLAYAIAGKILEISIPHEEGDTLKDVLTRRCEEEDIEIGVGTCVRFSDFGLRVAKMHEGKISRIEVIRAIH